MSVSDQINPAGEAEASIDGDLEENVGELRTIYETEFLLPTIDIIAVHGLTGDPQDSWTSGSVEDVERCMWLRDLLPKSVEGARVTTFSYGFETGHVADLLSAEGIQQSAQALLDHVLRRRDDVKDSRPPIAFIAHDVGGLIVKKALVMAEKNPDYFHISEDCDQVVFFCTPHRSSNSCSWEDLILNIVLASARPVSLTLNLATRVWGFSTFLKNLSSEFLFLRARRSIISVYQDSESSGSSPVIINRYSATTGLVHEVSAARITSHQDACKFPGEGLVYSVIAKALKAETDSDYRTCLSRLFDVSPAFTLPDHMAILFMDRDLTKVWPLTDYADWLERQSSCVIGSSGDSGSGKSFRASALYHKLKDGSKLVAYFSFTEVDARRASATSFLGSAVFQLLNQDPDRFSSIRHLFSAVDNSNAWTYAGILALFRSLVDTKSDLGPIHLIIDGLHRCDKSLQPLLEALLVIAADKHSLTPLKIALFSQKSSDFQKILDRYEGLCLPAVVLAGETTSPLTWVRSELAAQVIKDRSYHSTPTVLPKVMAALERCKNATEVSLTLQSLSSVDSDDAPHRLKPLLSLLDTLPPSVSDVVASRFRALRDWARTALGWISHAERPLTIDELATALMLTDNQGEFNFSFDPDDRYVDIAAAIEAALGPFLRVDTGGVVFSNDNIRKLFLRLVEDEREREPANPEEPRSVIPRDADIARLLLEYISWPRFADPMVEALKRDEFVQPTGPLFGLATYAVQFIPVHHKAAGYTGDVLELAKSPKVVMLWSIMNSKLNPTASPPDFCVAHPFLLAAQLGMTGIVRELQASATVLDRNVAIDLASWGGHADAVGILVRGASTGHIYHTARGLEYASVRGYEEIVEQLLERMHASQTLLPSQLDKLICRAAELGYEKQVSLFLRWDANIEAVPDGITPLQYAARNGHASLVDGLLTAGARPNSEAGTATAEPLLLAAGRGYELIVKRLIERGADVMRVSKDGTERSALFLAAEHGHEAVVRHLLHCDKTGNCKSSVDRVNAEAKTPLAIACIRGHDEIAKLLLETGASADTVDNDGHTALYYAVRPGGDALAEAILRRSSSLDKFKDIGDVFLRITELGQAGLVKYCLDHAHTRLVDYSSESNGRRALHVAAEKGFEEIVLLLLKAGADVEAPDTEGLTPLVTAAVAGEADLVRLLLERGAGTQRMMPDNQTVLSYVVRHAQDSSRHADVVRMLLNTDVDPNAVDDYKHVALHWAVMNSNSQVTKALVQHPRVDANAKGHWGWNALHHVTRAKLRDRKDIARLLIEAGTDPLGVDIDGWLPIHVAAASGDLDLMELLVEADALSLSLGDAGGKTALHFSVEHADALEWLLAHGLDVNARDNQGRTALISAAIQEADDSLRVLVANNANIKATEDTGRTALHQAAYYGRVGVGRQLLKWDRTLLSCRDAKNRSALHLAIDAGEPAFAIMLLEEHYAKIRDNAPGHTLEDLSATDTSDSETPLMSAVRREQSATIRALRKLNAETEKIDTSGMTALLAAVNKGDPDVLDALLDDTPGTRPNVNAGGGTRPTALHEAARDGQLAVVKALIGYGASVNAEGGQFNTAVSAAAACGWAETLEYLLVHSGQDVDVKLSGGNFANPLAAALYSYSETSEVIPFLLQASVDVNATDAQGRSSFHVAACRCPWYAVVQLRQAKGAEAPNKDRQGRTLLHHAAMSGDVDMLVKLLRDKDLALRVDAKDVNGWTPLHWACRQDSVDMVRTLVDWQVGSGASASSVIAQATPDGWTPGNIAATHDAGEVSAYLEDRLLEAAAQEGEYTGKEDASESVSRSAAKRLGLGRRWKVGVRHPGGMCDGCFIMPLMGVRWRCRNCQDFDYCFKCFWTVKATHDVGHEFKPFPEWAEDRRDPESESDPEQEPDEQEAGEDSDASSW